MTTPRFEGGCYCGDVRYVVEGSPRDETHCHCSICRRTTGAPLVTWFSVGPAELRVVQGRPATFASSDHGTRSFCARCGTQLFFASTRFPDAIDVTTCSLDDPGAVPPRDHTQTASRVSFLRLCDGLPEFPGHRD